MANGYALNAFHLNPCWQTAREAVLEGRSKVTRPTYYRGYSLRIVDPTNIESDVTLNSRYRHRMHDPISLRSSKYTRSMTQEEIERYQEIAEPLPDKCEYGKFWDYPHVIYRYPNQIIIHYDHVRKRGGCIELSHYIKMEMVRKGEVIKIRQSTDKLLHPKRKLKCRRCSGEKRFLFTYWNGIGVQSEDMEQYNLGWRDLIDVNGVDFTEPNLPTQVVNMLCTKCKGSGLSTSTWNRYDSKKWLGGQLIIDSNTRTIIS